MSTTKQFDDKGDSTWRIWYAEGIEVAKHAFDASGIPDCEEARAFRHRLNLLVAKARAGEGE